ncbi:Piezo-type mechanosensitive ion channel component 2 [Lamellibrachia satsuma]|nr:Piezo-type mechanosensitive ion channel component 2 [Lamellibrachia satsuma]
MFIIFICFTVYEVSAAHMFIVLLLVLFDLPFHHLQRTMSHCCVVLVAILLLTKMIYQLQTIPEGFFVCGPVDVNATLVRVNQSTNARDPAKILAAYTGFVKVTHVFAYIKVDFIVLLMLLFESIVIVHQTQYYTLESDGSPQVGIVFPHVNCEAATKDVYHCLMFFVNYGFYKFGLEICYSLAAINMVVRQDYYSIFYGVIVGLFLCMDRHQSACVWSIHIGLFLVGLCIQCATVLGLPDDLCFNSFYVSSMGWWKRTLSDYARPSDMNCFIGDYVYLLFLCQHWYVFKIETNQQLLHSYGGGSNANVCLNTTLVRQANPVKDFMSSQSTLMDYIQLYVFKNMFWVSMGSVFLSGASEVSLLGVGLCLCSFIWLWVGPYCIIRFTRRLQHLWCTLLAYSFAVIFLDCCRHVAACPHIATLTEHYCWVVQILHISCNGDSSLASECYLGKDTISNIWDVVSFICLLIQLRIFHTYYFQHVVLDLYVQDLLSHRGGDLINVNLLHHVEQRKYEEQRVLLKIKSKMQHIKKKLEDTRQRAAFVSNDHYKVIRSGDYYMFEDEGRTAG